MIPATVRIYGHPVISAPAEHRTHGPSRILARFPVERQHNVRTVQHRVPRSGQVRDFQSAGIQGLFGQPCLGSPGTMFMAHPYIPFTERQGGTRIFLEHDRLLLAIADDRPHLYHITVTVGPVAQVNLEIVLRVPCRDHIVCPSFKARAGIGDITQVRTEIPVGMRHAQRHGADEP